MRPPRERSRGGRVSFLFFYQSTTIGSSTVRSYRSYNLIFYLSPGRSVDRMASAERKVFLVTRTAINMTSDKEPLKP